MKQKNFLRCCFKYGGYFVAELLLSYILASVVVKGNTIIGDAIDSMLAGEKVRPAAFMGLLLFLTVAGFVVAFLKSVSASQFSIKVQSTYKNMVAEKLYHLEYRYFDKNGSASVLNKVNSDIAEIDTLLNQNIPELCTNIVAMITYAVYVGQINTGLLFLMLVCYPFVFWFTGKVVKKIQSLRKVFRQKSDIITEISQDCISGILVLRAFGAEDYFQEKLNTAADDLVANEEKRVRITNNVLIIRRMLQWMPNIICAIYAYYMVLKGNISLGELVVFLMILQRFVDSFIGVPFNLVDARETMVCVNRVEEILIQKEEVGGTAVTGLLRSEATREKAKKNKTEITVSEGKCAENEGEAEGGIEDAVIAFENVSFSYTEEKQVLEDLTFQIRNNTSVAFVGDSGGGKSTIFHLLCGFYPLDRGSYKLLGREFKEWNVEAARDHMSLVSQNVFLFPTTIMENVRYGNMEATDEQIIQACKDARIHDFIVGLPEGYDSIVGERGILLSGGERQRISIARAFLKNAPILLLDEPTSAIDVETEALIKEAIDKLSCNRTCITIAHRLSTIQNADEIMVLKDGKIVEKGTHLELLDKKGVYAGMYGQEISGKEGFAS